LRIFSPRAFPSLRVILDFGTRFSFPRQRRFFFPFRLPWCYNSATFSRRLFFFFFLFLFFKPPSASFFHETFPLLTHDWRLLNGIFSLEFTAQWGSTFVCRSGLEILNVPVVRGRNKTYPPLGSLSCFFPGSISRILILFSLFFRFSREFNHGFFSP